MDVRCLEDPDHDPPLRAQVGRHENSSVVATKSSMRKQCNMEARPSLGSQQSSLTMDLRAETRFGGRCKRCSTRSL